MKVDGTEFLLYGKTAYVTNYDSEEEIRLNVSIPVLNFLLEKGALRISYGHAENFIEIEEILARYNGRII